MPKREHLDELVKRLEGSIEAHRASNLPDVTVSYSDVERLMHAAVWGDD